METLLYAIIFALTVGFGLGLVLLRRADYQLFSLLGAMVCLALNWILLGLGYVALLQIVVYVGAIMVIFLFVIMLLNLRHPERFDLRALSPVRKLGFAFSTLFTLLIGAMAVYFVDWGATVPKVSGAAQPGAKEVARELITTWLYPFEVISLLLLAAVIAAIMIARTRPVIEVNSAAPIERPSAAAKPPAALEPPPA
jgi:NADH-quinone oxidoreductase subunit J